MSPVAQRYRIEEEGSAGRLSPAPRAPLDQVLATIRDLRSLVDCGVSAPDPADGRGEAANLRFELEAMKEAIASTKREVVSLSRSERQGSGVRRAAGELDAVADATGEATATILRAVEEIEAQARSLRASGVAGGQADPVGAILDRVVLMYEACHFHDLTGQRISRVVGVLKFIEERLDRMIEVWGGVAALQERAEREGSTERSLLNGPKLAHDEGHVDQKDIDALFG